MSKKAKISQKDLVLFQHAMQGVRPLSSPKKQSLRIPTMPRRQSIAVTDPSLTNQAHAFSFHETDLLATVSGETMLSFKRSGISDKILRKLRKGQYTIEATLDLHGLSIEMAKTAVNDFLLSCMQDNLRAVLIIHGKGQHDRMPILKNKLNQWLRDISVILAFCSATAAHGRGGAIYVLLKRGHPLA
ncbi:MAG TPA: Smr/MutS family protein [Gammaproteobacteria bacterium]|jgi:DNA-nicking Smr family endonuclease|nr:Smr/MutS family protein [Gammaproteobacteria bacterium]